MLRAEEVQGYNVLSDEHKEMFKYFCKRCGFDDCSPVYVAYVKQIDYLHLVDPKEQIYKLVKTELIDMADNQVISMRKVERPNETIDEEEIKLYLRFSYRKGNRNEWQHIIKDESKTIVWY